MPSYMTIAVIALAASNVSVALSAPVHSSSREVREQSLSRRQNRPLTPEGPPEVSTHGGPSSEAWALPFEGPPSHGGPPPGQSGGPPPGHSGPPPGQPGGPPQDHSGPPPKPAKAPPKAVGKGGSNIKSYALNFALGTAATMVGISLLKGLSGSESESSTPPPSSAASPSADSTSSTSSDASNVQYSSGQYYPSDQYYPNNQYNQYYPNNQYKGQYQNQRRGVDHGKRADFFEEKARSNSDNDRRATSHLESLSRAVGADLEEALKLLSRALDELD